MGANLTISAISTTMYCYIRWIHWSTDFGVPWGRRDMGVMGESPSRSTKYQLMSRKRASIPGVGDLDIVKQGTCLNSATISFRLGELIGVTLSLISPPRVWPTGVPSFAGQVSSAEELTTSSCLGLTVSEWGTCAVGASKTGFSWETSERVLLAGGGVAESALERRLCYLSLKPTLRFGVISVSSSSFSSRMMQGTTGSNSWFERAPMEGEPVEPWLVPVSEEDVGEEVDEERSNASLADRETNFSLVWRRIVELVVRCPELVSTCPRDVYFLSVQVGLAEPLHLLSAPLRRKGGPSICDVRWTPKLWVQN